MPISDCGLWFTVFIIIWIGGGGGGSSFSEKNKMGLEFKKYIASV